MVDKYYTSADIAARFGFSPKHASRIARHLARANGISKTGRDWLIPAAIVENYKPARVGRPKGQKEMNEKKSIALVNPWTHQQTSQVMTWTEILVWATEHIHRDDRPDWLRAAHKAFKAGDGDTLGAMIIGS